MNRCPDCGESEMEYSKDTIHCKNCGLVVDDSPIESNPYVPEGKKIMSTANGETAGTMPVHGKFIKNHWLISTKQKNMYKAKKSLGLIASKLKLPKSAEKDAFLIFKRAVEIGLNVGRDNKSMLYASVYASCIMHNIPKTPLEITVHSGMSRNKMLNSYKVLKHELHLKVDQIDPIDFVQRFGSRLELSQPTMTLATQILIKLKGCPVIVGKHPKTIVASAIYLASKMNKEDHRTQREVANATGIIEVTLRKRTKEIMRCLKIE